MLYTPTKKTRSSLNAISSPRCPTRPCTRTLLVEVIRLLRHDIMARFYLRNVWVTASPKNVTSEFPRTSKTCHNSRAWLAVLGYCPGACVHGAAPRVRSRQRQRCQVTFWVSQIVSLLGLSAGRYNARCQRTTSYRPHACRFLSDAPDRGLPPKNSGRFKSRPSSLNWTRLIHPEQIFTSTPTIDQLEPQTSR